MFIFRFICENVSSLMGVMKGGAAAKEAAANAVIM